MTFAHVHPLPSGRLFLSPKQEDTDRANMQLTQNQEQLSAPQTLHLQSSMPLGIVWLAFFQLMIFLERCQPWNMDGCLHALTQDPGSTSLQIAPLPGRHPLPTC